MKDLIIPEKLIKGVYATSLSVIILPFFVVSCSPENEWRIIEYSNIPSEKVEYLTPSVEYQPEDLFGAYMVYPLDDTHLLFQFTSGYFFKSWDLINNSTVSSFLRYGRGPDEITSAGVPHARRDYDGNILIDVLTPQKELTIDYNVTLKSDKNYITSSIDRSAVYSDGKIMNLFQIEDGFLCRVEGDMDIYSYKLIDKNTGDVKKVFSVPQFFEGNTFQLDYSSYALLKPDNSKLALIMYEQNRIIVFDLISDDHFSITIDSDESGFNTGACNDDHIFALRTKHSGEQSIHVLDWDGNYVEELSVGESLMSFSVDSIGSSLWGLSEDNHLFGYVL